ncbi:MAG TPA: YciI family protein [Vicinamibacterales bacterium]|nr:YciI family protein [Vicinamibacterales bacterium]
MTSVLFLALILQSAPADEPRLQMMTYQMVFLWRGVATAEQGADADKAQQAHLAHLTKLNRERVNLLFGPFLDEGDLRGLAVLDVPDADTARKLFTDDPHVKSGALKVEVKPWMGPKGWFHPPAETDVTRPGALEQLVFGFLKRGPNRSQSKTEAEELQKRHLAYMDALGKQGTLVMAGPFLEDSEWRGVVVYRVPTLEDAKALAAGDPMVKAGRLIIEAHPWMTLRGILK